MALNTPDTETITAIAEAHGLSMASDEFSVYYRSWLR